MSDRYPTKRGNPPPRVPRADERLATDCILTAPITTAKVEHLPRFPNQRWGAPYIACGGESRRKGFWVGRTTLDREVSMCAMCQRQKDEPA